MTSDSVKEYFVSKHMANKEHLERIRLGVNAWNEWRRQNPKVMPDLMGAELNTSTYNLHHFSGANFREVNLRGTEIWSADLQGANLEGARLDDADLYFVDFQNANLRDSDFQDATLRYLEV